MIRFSDASRGRVEVCPHCHEYVDVPDPSAKPDVGKAHLAASERVSPDDGATASQSAESSNRRSDCDGACAARCDSPSTTVGDAVFDDPALVAEAPYPSTRRLWLEVVVVMALGVVPAFVASTGQCAGWQTQRTTFCYDLATLVSLNLQASLPLLWILFLGGEPWARFGIVRFSWHLDILSGVGFWACGLAASYFVVLNLPDWLTTTNSSYWATQPARPDGIAAVALALVASLTNGFAEEFVLRGYLLPRFERLMHSTFLALAATTVLFASYHAYQGAFGVANAAAIGMVYGAAFCLQRRLWPVAIAHAIADLAGFL